MRHANEFGDSTIRAVIRWGVAIKIAGLILLFDAGAFQSFELPKTLFSHALAWPLAALILISLWQYGTGIVPRSRITLAVGAVAVTWLASTAFAADRYLAVFGDLSRLEGLTYLADMIVLYIAVAIVCREPRDFALPAKAFAVATVVVLVYGFIQRVGLDPVKWARDPIDRPFSVFGNPDIFGHFLSLTFGLLVGVAIFSAGTQARLLRVVAIPFALVTGIAAGLVATRGTFVGIAAAVAALPIVIVRVRGMTRATLATISLGTIAVLALSLALLFATPLGARVRATVTEGAEVRGRVLLFEAALKATRDRPLFGWGPDSFAVAYPNYRSSERTGDPGNQPESSAHNWLLEAAATTGILGALATLALALIGALELYRVGLKRVPSIAGPLLIGLVAYWAHGLVSVGSVSVDWFGWAALGAAAGITTTAVPAEARRRLAVNGLTLAVGASCVVGLAGFLALDASHLAGSARTALKAERFDAAAASAIAAANRDSGRAEYWELVGLAHAGNERWREAADAFAEAARRAPYNATHYANLARNRTQQALAGDQSGGGSATALDAARRAATTDPNNWESQSVLAEVQNVFGQSERALETLAVAVALNQDNPFNDVVASEASAKVSDANRARALVERILELKESAVLRIALANVGLRLNDRELALRNAHRALALDPGNADALKVVATLGG